MPHPPQHVEDLRLLRLDQPIAEGPTTRGFDTYFGVDLPNLPPYTFIKNDRLTAPATGPKPRWPGLMKPGWRLEGVLPELTRRAVSYVTEKGRSKQPYFLYFPMSSPHTPIAPDDEFFGKSKAGKYGDFDFQTALAPSAVGHAKRPRSGSGRGLSAFGVTYCCCSARTGWPSLSVIVKMSWI